MASHDSLHGGGEPSATSVDIVEKLQELRVGDGASPSSGTPDPQPEAGSTAALKSESLAESKTSKSDDVSTTVTTGHEKVHKLESGEADVCGSVAWNKDVSGQLDVRPKIPKEVSPLPKPKTPQKKSKSMKVSVSRSYTELVRRFRKTSNEWEDDDEEEEEEEEKLEGAAVQTKSSSRKGNSLSSKKDSNQNETGENKASLEQEKLRKMSAKAHKDSRVRHSDKKVVKNPYFEKKGSQKMKFIVGDIDAADENAVEEFQDLDDESSDADFGPEFQNMSRRRRKREKKNRLKNAQMEETFACIMKQLNCPDIDAGICDEEDENSLPFAEAKQRKPRKPRKRKSDRAAAQSLEPDHSKFVGCSKQTERNTYSSLKKSDPVKPQISDQGEYVDSENENRLLNAKSSQVNKFQNFTITAKADGSRRVKSSGASSFYSDLVQKNTPSSKTDKQKRLPLNTHDVTLDLDHSGSASPLMSLPGDYDYSGVYEFPVGPGEGAAAEAEGPPQTSSRQMHRRNQFRQDDLRQTTPAHAPFGHEDDLQVATQVYEASGRSSNSSRQRKQRRNKKKSQQDASETEFHGGARESKRDVIGYNSNQLPLRGVPQGGGGDFEQGYHDESPRFRYHRVQGADQYPGKHGQGHRGNGHRGQGQRQYYESPIQMHSAQYYHGRNYYNNERPHSSKGQGHHQRDHQSGDNSGASHRHQGQQAHRQHKSDHAQKSQNNTSQGQMVDDEHHRQGKKKKPRKREQMRYETYLPAEEVSKRLKQGSLIQGSIRINPRNYTDAYVPLPDGSSDIFICGFQSRNRALNGDIVAVELLDQEKWRVYTDDLEHYEAKLKLEKGQGGNDSDSGPDVVVEQEEVVTPGGQGDTRGSVKKREKRTPRHGYTTVSDIIHGGSPLAKSLFKPPEGASGDSGASVDKLMQKTGKVVAIIEQKHSRACSGHLKLMQDSNPDYALFSPGDSRVPRIQIPMSQCPKDFYTRPDDHSNTLFIARITQWKETSVFAQGILSRSIGEAGLIEPETEALLIEHDVETQEFSDEVLECLPKNLPWVIPASEFEYRRDLRKQCIFTIDPSTARDLDDAVSIEDLGDGHFEVGVHIADVSFFMAEDTALDKKAAYRSTSVYLVQKVVPMLPRLLCEELCSLNPDEDRLTFSVIWKMDAKGEISEEWFGRTVIRSCAKLSYDHAQGFIEEPERDWTTEELPPITNGATVEDLKKRVIQLDKIAKCMRKKRFDDGALRLDQVKLSFSLDSETGMPNGYSVYEQRDSNRLIEEFMLLANMAVAHRIYDVYPKTAFLRRHPPPQTKMVDDLQELCQSIGISLDLSNSLKWQESLNAYQGSGGFEKARMQVLVALSSRPMQNARYFCSGAIEDPEVYHHYALNVPLYTHFTSPIRRYADVIVHRLLAASLGYCDMISKDQIQLQHQAEHCNDKKYLAKKVQEMSSELFFAAFIKEAGPFEEEAMVMGVMDHSFDVFILKFGVTKRIYCDQLNIKSKTYIKENKQAILNLVWQTDDKHPNETAQKIKIFTKVIVFAVEDKDPLKWKALLKRPSVEDN